MDVTFFEHKWFFRDLLWSICCHVHADNENFCGHAAPAETSRMFCQWLSSYPAAGMLLLHVLEGAADSPGVDQQHGYRPRGCLCVWIFHKKTKQNLNVSFCLHLWEQEGKTSTQEQKMTKMLPRRDSSISCHSSFFHLLFYFSFNITFNMLNILFKLKQWTLVTFWNYPQIMTVTT